MSVAMDAKPAYTGTHKVVLPAGYLNSIEAAVELHAEQIASVAANLDCPVCNSAVHSAHFGAES